MRVIRKGDRGEDVKHWQNFLVGLGLLDVADGVYGPKTKQGTIAFQKKFGLKPDGIVGNSTYGRAMVLGFFVVQKDESDDKESTNFPPKPDFKPLSEDGAKELFGEFKFKADRKGRLVLLDNWKKKNIVTVRVPQTLGIEVWGRPRTTDAIRFHKKGAEQLKSLWASWEKEKVLDKVLTWDGSYVPRFIRGSKTRLSNHAFGTAFDINVKWNGLGKRPALVGEKGSVRELVEIANEHGFYWGGHFRRYDGMHFELAKVL